MTVEFRRVLDVKKLAAKKSFFLIGQRATGKSFLIQQQLGGQAVVIDLLRSVGGSQLAGVVHRRQQLESILARSD